MNPRLMFGALSFLTGVLLAVLPDLARRGLLFGVPVEAEFRKSDAGKRALLKFHLTMAGAMEAALLAITIVDDAHLGDVIAGVQVGLCLIACAAFLWQNRRLQRFAVQAQTISQEALVSNEPERLPRYVWAAAGPPLIFAASWIYLHAHWGQIPARFPIHWDVHGLPNRWSERSVHGVYGPLLFGFTLYAWMTVMSFAGWYGARRSRLRRGVLGCTLGAGNFVALVLAAGPLHSIVAIPGWAIPVCAMLVLAVTVAALGRSVAGEAGAAVEPTPNECWRAGFLYFNPADAALFVEKRFGIGYTLNFGNSWSWLLLFSLAVILICGTRLL